MVAAVSTVSTLVVRGHFLLDYDLLEIFDAPPLFDVDVRAVAITDPIDPAFSPANRSPNCCLE